MVRKILIVLSSLGLLNSLYLTWIKLFERGACSISKGCEIVNTSPYASMAGIPIALLGAGAYALMLASLLLETRREFFEFNGPLLVFGLSLVGTLFSIYLTIVEIVVIYAICFFCVVSAFLMLLILIFSGLRLQRTLSSD